MQVIDARDAVVVAPLLAGAIRTGHHQPMQHGEEHRALDRKLEAAPGEQLVHHRSALGVAPRPLEQQRRTDPFTGQLRDAAFVQQRQHHRSLRQAGDGADQSVEMPRRSTSSLRPSVWMMRCLFLPSSRTLSTR